MIRRFGIGVYVENNIERVRGTSKASIEGLRVDDALEVLGTLWREASEEAADHLLSWSTVNLSGSHDESIH